MPDSTCKCIPVIRSGYPSAGLYISVNSSVADPNPDPPDLLVFGPPGSGSGSFSQIYGFESGSFYHLAKIVRKTLIFTVF
jgi:hypothetical protein